MDFRRRRTDLGAGALKSNQPELADLVFRSLDLKGQLPLELEREYGLEFVVEDFTRKEFYRPRRRAWWGGGHLLAAGGAGTYNCWQLLCPGAETLTVVERIILAPSPADLFYIGIGTAAAGGLARTVRSMDSRNGVGAGSGASTFQTAQPAAPAIGAGSILVRAAATEYTVVEGPWILGPSSTDALIVAQGTPNQPGACSFIWSERHAVPSEVG